MTALVPGRRYLAERDVRLLLEVEMTGHIEGARPSDVADAVAFLASKEAGFINGVDLQVDGGFAQI